MIPLPVMPDRNMSFLLMNKTFAIMTGPGKCLQWVKERSLKNCKVKDIFQRDEGALTHFGVWHLGFENH